MAELKTILFTDIVRSVDLKSEMPGRSDSDRDVAFIEQILMPHRQRIEQNLAALDGRVVSTAGDGHFLVFSDTISAAQWAVDIQRSHRDEPIKSPKGSAVEVRISLHLGTPQVDPADANNFIGKPVDYAARLNDYATGKQILISRSVVAVLEDAGMEGVKFHNHGKRDLRGIGRIDVYELLYDGSKPLAMRARPREWVDRQWTVLPLTMGLSEFRDPTFPAHWGRAGGRPQPPGRPGGQRDDRTPEPATDVIPLRLGNYELEQRLGSGGMGDVYRARHSHFNRVRAVKVIKQHFVDSGHDEVIRRFYQEIKAVGALEHPNIVVAIDSSAPSDDVHYLVMEYIEGVAADELVGKHGPLAIADACEIVRQAARGLAYIHEHGMVHRDIKPSNLMLTLARTDMTGSASVGSVGSGAKAGDTFETPVVKILDLGLALLVGEDQQRLTVFDNRAMGTAMYMSPEQWKSSSVDIRADIYSLGCTLYHLLAGKPPFLESDFKPEKAHEREQLPAMQRDPPIPRQLWEVLKRMTAKNPNDRYAEPSEVMAALAPFAEGNHLADLAREMIGSSPHERTHGMAKTETLVARSAQTDTRPRTHASWRSQALSGISRQRLSRIGMGIATLAAVVVIGWLALQATMRRTSVEKALEARKHTLQVSAQFAASEILKEIDLRFDILGRLAADDDLRKQMTEINREPGNTELWKRLEDWLGARKSDNDGKAASDSWFIDDAHGVQVARSPRSEASRGENYAHRDYFHGQGVDLPPETKNLKPIEEPHLSAVYRSTSTGHLKVAFSVPISNGRKGKEREIVGVLAMSVDLGEFNVLQKSLPPGLEVVLIDLRPATIDGQTRRGLVLHHQRDESAYREGQPPPWISGKTLAEIDRLASSTATDPAHNAAILGDFEDEALTGGEHYLGAVQLVEERSTEQPSRDVRWTVLVEEPLER